MPESYKVLVNEDFEFDLTSKDIENLDAISLSHNQVHLVSNEASITAQVSEAHIDNRTYTVVINGNSYAIKIKNRLDTLIEDMGLGLGLDAVVDDIFAPMPGAILSIDVAVGDAVKEGDTLCILEAMKMENALLSPRDGVIKSIEVSTSDTVEKSALLMSLEPLQ